MSFEQAKKENGSINTNGIEIALCQSAVAENHGVGVRYFAQGVDLEGNIYQVAWDTTQAWDDADLRAQESLKSGEELDAADAALLSDASNACEWDKPVSITLID